mmetsp:Transcript_22026/g.62587  ORF Transcript_22026/g.62587 Transcript_22026/m.62587 type:complete len:208 (-) Transcript_22026:514-1137(-)
MAKSSDWVRAFSQKSTFTTIGEVLISGIICAGLVVVSPQTNEALFTPVSTPAVLRDPEFYSMLLAVANKQHLMVDGYGGLAAAIKDTTLVRIPPAGVDSDGHWATSSQYMHHGMRIIVYLSETFHTNSRFSALGAQLAWCTRVQARVMLREWNTFSTGKMEGVPNSASIAAIVLCVPISSTISHCLRRKCKELCRGDCQVALQSLRR